MRQEIRICGFGGQGVITASVILGKAAAVYDNLIACQSQSYGPEARGGAARAEVIIDDKPIGCPGVHVADILIAMSLEAFTRYGRDVKPDGTIIIDPDLVATSDLPERAYPIPATRIAENLGNTVVANIVMLGAVTAITGVVSEEAIHASTVKSVPARFKELNERALAAGMAAGRELKGLGRG
ncbi:MAG: 2-oxoacid:ferredoxin oxidoreductase subunit gamma [Candidatus Viridilinea halotolerans]|uniref:2-oxoacid:ferredoxin oxidoreductase subunit gamma n=1 Tax=Candidatus Viridilinea halotolerans TaxID=2491704 RepID=A0A426UC60_9CHLR|nr:MAG: 2-oxoacid:ferredoxin oxidoreductase subunit gamma [Candidatus Viridilinea halotolerans]